jgi:HAD superfamily hydrolase (TIGR01509 family)
VSDGPIRPEAILWDMDGTIVDTEPYWIEAEFDVVESHGGSWSHEHGKALVGSDLLDSGRYIREHGGIDVDPRMIVEMLLDRVVNSVRREVPWRPGARDLLASVRADGFATALVTMSWRRFAVEVVGALPADSFDTLVVGDDVERGKPHPDPYVLAAERLGVDPARCLAIEDSPTGVASALAAGCRVLAVPHIVPVPPPDDPLAPIVFRDSLEGLSSHDMISMMSLGVSR